ncbi:hypothetical protein Y032_0132g1736 [Ancylostoma ceylanicum]|uniref:Uncharacterized protein n=1 Tax=Ancylostoma ceylanicum TaxID=53326 RepID=A0A016T5T3_9BILA|nr:hypothetical protein Y032_0132g1736 [Ancylostoma ceylanicum]
MMGLVDYGSDSESEAEGALEDVGASAPSSSKPAASQPLSNGQDDSHFTADEVFEGSSSLKLPSVIETTSTNIVEEGELEEIVKPKDWEVKLAEKERRRREKKAKKKEKKEKRGKGGEKTETGLPSSATQGKGTKAKTKIAAFGALNAIADGTDSNSDEEQVARPSDLPSKPKGSGLLAMLPTPKRGTTKNDLGGAVSKGTCILLPPSLRNKTKPPSTTTKVKTWFLGVFVFP